MKALFNKLFSKGNKKTEKNDFSAFFRDAKSKEKKRVIMEIVRKSNADQREIIEKYNKKLKTL